MKLYPMLMVLLLVTNPVQAGQTDWLRIGQVKNYVVDINKLSIVAEGESISAAARFIPRSSAADWEALDPKPTLRDPRPIFFKISFAKYNCSTQEVSDISETHFDANVKEVGALNEAAPSTAPEEYALVRQYLCRKK